MSSSSGISSSRTSQSEGLKGTLDRNCAYILVLKPKVSRTSHNEELSFGTVYTTGNKSSEVTFFNLDTRSPQQVARGLKFVGTQTMLDTGLKDQYTLTDALLVKRFSHNSNSAAPVSYRWSISRNQTAWQWVKEALSQALGFFPTECTYLENELIAKGSAPKRRVCNELHAFRSDNDGNQKGRILCLSKMLRSAKDNESLIYGIRVPSIKPEYYRVAWYEGGITRTLDDVCMSAQLQSMLSRDGGLLLNGAVTTTIRAKINGYDNHFDVIKKLKNFRDSSAWLKEALAVILQDRRAAESHLDEFVRACS